MTRLLDRLPVPTTDTMAFLAGEMVRIHAYEIVVWVSVAGRDVGEPDGLPRFPALLDTAHTHNFSIREDHLVRWAGLRPESLVPGPRRVRWQGQSLSLKAAHLWLHANEPGTWDRTAPSSAYRLLVPEGIVVHPSETAFPRLPLLGLRAILRNKLALHVDGRTGLVQLSSPSRWWPFG